MEPIRLGCDSYRDKVLACWLGKNIGGTLGAPYECQKHMHDLDFYEPVPTQPLPNDDLDLQLVWLKMLEEEGSDPPLPAFADYWMRYISAYPWNEYGFCGRNLARGLLPPVSGCFENYYVDEMGSPIRSEIWACTAPADPQLAAARAWKDSALDHAGGEGMHGEMFWAAVESAAFVCEDPLTLIRVGLDMIPVPCQISRVVREAVWCYRNGLRWAEARHRIATTFGHQQPCNAVPNHGFIVLGWLYGEDFGDKLCKAVNCGYDTDCTGATLGSVLGIAMGTAGIPARWREPVGEGIVPHKFTGECDPPGDVHELTERTVAVGEQAIAALSPGVKLARRTELPADVLTRLHRNEKARAALAQDVHAAVAVSGDTEIWLHYGGEPVIRPGIGKVLEVTVGHRGRKLVGDAEMTAPPGWRVQHAESSLRQIFTVTADESGVGGDLHVRIAGGAEAEFRILGAQQAAGYPAGQNVPRCETCHGMEGYCICTRRS